MQNQNDLVQIVLQKMQQENNPLMKNFMDLSQRGDTKGMEQIIRNAGKEKGIDVDAQFSNFINQLRQMGFKV